jgi:hypothetical protein
MSANAIGKYLPFAAPSRVPGSFPRERRTSVRTAVHWPVAFRNGRQEPIESITENLSSQGFYCFFQTPIASGEMLMCRLTVPTYDPFRKNENTVLECNVRVIRSETATAEGLYGIAFQIEDYHFGG